MSAGMITVDPRDTDQMIVNLNSSNEPIFIDSYTGVDFGEGGLTTTTTGTAWYSDGVYYTLPFDHDYIMPQVSSQDITFPSFIDTPSPDTDATQQMHNFPEFMKRMVIIPPVSDPNKKIKIDFEF